MSDKPSAAEAGEAAAPDGPILTGKSESTGFSPAYTNYVLVMVTLVYVINYLDRQILGILSKQIKVEFNLEGWQIGVLNGPAFALLYAILGIPIALLADRTNRRTLITLSMTLFSLMTVLSGYAKHYWHLLAFRIGTGIGEAGTGPAINSIIADLYPPQKRAAALSFYTAGLNIGLLIGFFGGGWIAEHYGWRHAFWAAGIPGLILAVVVQLTVREPKRGMVEKLEDKSGAQGFWTVARYLWAQPSFRWMSVGTGLNAFGGYAGITFIPLFLYYSHGLKEAQIGLVLSILTGVFGALGTYLAGVFADRFGAKDVRWNLYVPIIAVFVAIPFAPFFYLTDNIYIALTAAIVPSLVGAAYVGPAYAVTQRLVPLRMRATAVALLLFVLNVIGYGLGPPVIGYFADLLTPWAGNDSYRYAMLFGMITALSGAYCYWRATRTLKTDIARVVESGAS
ncbi:MAG: MFS transporter [Alphaproteobacteria bacterium]|nr:MFS transporter [Alphaproteobacteria bacterium]